MSRVRLDDDGCSVNSDHIVIVERKESGITARLVSGNTVKLQDVHPVTMGLKKVAVGPDVWVNPVHVSVVDVAYNRDASFKDALAGVNTDKEAEFYMHLRVVTVLGDEHEVWADMYEKDEIDYLAGLILEGDWNG